MIRRKSNVLTAGLREGRFANMSRRLFRSGLSRRSKSRWGISAEIDRLEERTLLTANPLAGQFMVRETNAFEGSNPSVAVQESTGDFVVAWASFEQPGGDTSGLGIYVQLFNADGTAKTDPLLVNSFTQGDQDSPTVAIDANGNFVVAWESLGQDGSGYGVYAEQFTVETVADVTTATGGGEFRVNTETTDDQEAPAIGMDLAGNFVIAWQSFGQDGDGYGIYAQQYMADGSAIGGEFQVNTVNTDGDQTNPTVAVAKSTMNANFVIAWQGQAAAAPGEVETSVEIYAHLYGDNNSTRTDIRDEFLVNTITDKDQINPAVCDGCEWRRCDRLGNGRTNGQRFGYQSPTV